MLVPPLTVPPFHLEYNHLRCLEAYKFAELLKIAIPCVAWL